VGATERLVLFPTWLLLDLLAAGHVEHEDYCYLHGQKLNELLLVDKLNAYFSPKQNSSFERHVFRNLCPTEGEGFAKCVLRLRLQVLKCDFGATKEEVEEISLKDKIIDSLAGVNLKKKLLEIEYTLVQVIDASQVDKEINKQSEIMHSRPETEAIRKISGGSVNPNRPFDGESHFIQRLVKFNQSTNQLLQIICVFEAPVPIGKSP